MAVGEWHTEKYVKTPIIRATGRGPRPVSVRSRSCRLPVFVIEGLPEVPLPESARVVAIGLHKLAQGQPFLIYHTGP